MGIFGNIKRAMGGGGGVGVKLEAPKSFTWEDKQLELKVTLLGHKPESRTVERIEFQLQDKPEDQGSGDSSSSVSNQSGNIVDYLWEFPGPIALGPKAEQTVTVSMPLPFTSSVSTPLAVPDAVGGFLGKMLSSVSTGPPTNVRNYQLTAKAFMEDIKGSANASRTIRYGGAFQMNAKIGGIRVT